MSTEAESKFSDRELICKECNNPWTFTVGEQEFYAEKEFENDPDSIKLMKTNKNLPNFHIFANNLVQNQRYSHYLSLPAIVHS